jgi:hypothetical protein
MRGLITALYHLSQALWGRRTPLEAHPWLLSTPGGQSLREMGS